MNKAKISIIGGAGYTAGELLRLLLMHPHIEISQVISKSQTGKYVTDIHQDLTGRTNLVFDSTLTDDYDAIFLCMGHGKSGEFLENHPECLKKIVIDLSNEYRLDGDHKFVYGLPEWQRDKIQQSHLIANPGCFATAIQLSLLPLAQLGLIVDPIHVTAITGATGAGQNPSKTTHFAWRTDNVSTYKTFQHQHEPEIKQSLFSYNEQSEQQVYFVPIRGDFARGIFASVYTSTDRELDELYQIYTSFYNTHPFVQILSDGVNMKQVTNTNNCFLHLQKEKDMVIVSSVIDNLIKGASGQAIQNLNLIMGWPENTGLLLKANYF